MPYVALTARRLKEGTSAEDFLEKFGMPDDAPAGWKRFYAVRNVEDAREIITFGFFDGTLDELNASQQEGYEEVRRASDPLVESFGTSGLFEVIEAQER